MSRDVTLVAGEVLFGRVSIVICLFKCGSLRILLVAASELLFVAMVFASYGTSGVRLIMLGLLLFWRLSTLTSGERLFSFSLIRS